MAASDDQAELEDPDVPEKALEQQEEPQEGHQTGQHHSKYILSHTAVSGNRKQRNQYLIVITEHVIWRRTRFTLLMPQWRNPYISRPEIHICSERTQLDTA